MKYHYYHFFLFSCLMLLLFPFSAKAQRNKIYSDSIASLQVVMNDNWQEMPIIKLNTDDIINIDFDDFTHSYHRYAYKIEHCDADWSVSQGIFSSDYIEGFAENNVIEDFEESINTTNLYSHYHFQIPDDNVKLKISGNYKVTVYDMDNSNQPIFTACFMVVEPLMAIGLNVTTQTDIDTNLSHQQLSMVLNYGNLKVTDYLSQIKTVVLQNGRYDNAVYNTKPQFVKLDGLEWIHNSDLIFSGNNEYHKFEMLDVSHPTMGVENINWDGIYYNAYIWPNEPRPNYDYDESANGGFLIRNSDNRNISTTCDYLQVHFKLISPQADGDVYLNGNWTHDSFLQKYKMDYDQAGKFYYSTVLLKQGYYSYQYLVLHPDGTTAGVPSEGNFYQTKNKYQALIYYRDSNGRYDQLVGYKEIQIK